MSVKGHEDPIEQALERAKAALLRIKPADRRSYVAVRLDDEAADRVILEWTDEATEAKTLSDLSDETGVPEHTLIAFARAVSRLGIDRDLPEEAVERAALLAAAGDVWEGELGPLLSSIQTAELLGGVSRQRVSDLLHQRRLIGVRTQAGRTQFPAFQFEDGQAVPALVEAFWVIAEHASDWTAASWCVAADDALGGESPASWARSGGDPDRLARVARQDAARLAA